MIRVLICDDEPFNIQGLIIVLKAAIKKMGYKQQIIDDLVEKCYNGNEALGLVKARLASGQGYGLIFMDC